MIHLTLSSPVNFLAYLQDYGFAGVGPPQCQTAWREAPTVLLWDAQSAAGHRAQ